MRRSRSDDQELIEIMELRINQLEDIIADMLSSDPDSMALQDLQDELFQLQMVLDKLKK